MTFSAWRLWLGAWLLAWEVRAFLPSRQVRSPLERATDQVFTPALADLLE
jgi:hypothetical protein